MASKTTSGSCIANQGLLPVCMQGPPEPAGLLVCLRSKWFTNCGTCMPQRRVAKEHFRKGALGNRGLSQSSKDLDESVGFLNSPNGQQCLWAYDAIRGYQSWLGQQVICVHITQRRVSCEITHSKVWSLVEDPNHQKPYRFKLIH